MRTCKFLEQSYSPFPSRRCPHNPVQPMLEELQLEKSRRRHIWPSKDWSHCGTGETTRSPSILSASHCCCFHHSPFLQLQPGNALTDTEHKMEQRNWESLIKGMISSFSLFLFLCICRIELS
jgi:hypothetical protein